MNSLNTLSHFSLKFTTPRSSFSTPRRSRRRPRRTNNDNYNNYNPLFNPSSDYENNINLVLDFNQISILSSSSKSKFHRFLTTGKDAYTDLKTVITFDDNGRLLLSCRKSTLQFFGSLLLSGFVLVFVFRFFVKLGLGVRDRFGVRKQNVVVRRDRSLGGREVVVATREEDVKKGSFDKVLKNPLSPGQITRSGYPGLTTKRSLRVRVGRKTPKWWPVQEGRDRSLVVDKEEYQREANRLIRAIIDLRTSGQDIMEDDVIQLRRICRTSGVRVSIDTTNTRDSLYRTSVDFVLNLCSRAPSHSTSVQIDGEDARQFVAGLADNIGLENVRAARMVSAAVAARTRSCFLQAWALEMQGNHYEAVVELSKLCLIHHIFPPEESSPEMEMVARGLEKLLNMEQREFLMKMLVGVCREESHRSAAEALGLVLSPEDKGIHHETTIPEN